MQTSDIIQHAIQNSNTDTTTNHAAEQNESESVPDNFSTSEEMSKQRSSRLSLTTIIGLKTTQAELASSREAATETCKQNQVALNECLNTWVDDIDDHDLSILTIVQEMNEKLYQQILIGEKEGINFNPSMISIINSMNEELINDLKPKNHGITDSLLDIAPIKPPSLKTIVSRQAKQFISQTFDLSAIEPTHVSTLDTPGRTKDQKVKRVYYGSVNKVIRTLFMICYVLLVYWFNKETSGYHMMSWMLISIYIIFFVRFIYLYSSTTKLSALNIVRTNVKGFGAVSFPYQIEYHPTHVVGSISQLSAIRGSNAYTTLYDMTTHSGILLFCALGFKWHDICIRNDFYFGNYESLSIICALATAFGTFNVGVWELNISSKLHIAMHYFGAVGLVLIGVAGLFQLNFSILSIVIFIFNLSLWAIYFFFQSCYYEPKYEDFDYEKVHKVSIVLITLEVIAWIALACTITFYVYNLEEM